MNSKNYQVMGENNAMLLPVIPPSELFHRCVRVWAMTSSGLMLQVLRRPTPRRHGGWDPIVVDAHVERGQNPLEVAMRQLEDDLGWRVARIELKSFQSGDEFCPPHRKAVRSDSATGCWTYSLLLPAMVSADLKSTFSLDARRISKARLQPLDDFEQEMAQSDRADNPAYVAKSVVSHLREQQKAVEG